MRANVSHWPIAVRLATSGAAPAFSAVTYWLLEWARSAIAPPPWSISSNRWAAPMLGASAISGVVPLAVTYLPLAWARRLTTCPVGGGSGAPRAGVGVGARDLAG